MKKFVANEGFGFSKEQEDRLKTYGDVVWLEKQETISRWISRTPWNVI